MGLNPTRSFTAAFCGPFQPDPLELQPAELRSGLDKPEEEYFANVFFFFFFFLELEHRRHPWQFASARSS
ncbi:hypothetical protein NL676_011159 [Syzygium grande]|nr:hypothetical protein NL676_011159 [Syzygium grande]